MAQSRRMTGVTGLATVVMIVGLLAGTGTASAAAPVTNNVPLSTLPAATPASPVTGTLPSGVTYTVDRGAWSTTGQGYAIKGGQSQTWTFSEPVQVAFSVSGLNCGGEAATLPANTLLVALAGNHTYNPTTRVVANAGAAAPGDASSFKLTGYVTTFTWNATGVPTCGRGLQSLALTYQAVDAQPDNPMTTQGTPVEFDPTENDTPTDGASFDRTTFGLIDPANPSGPPVQTVTTSAGTYTVTPSGTVTFTPDPTFVGTAPPVSYVVTDTNGVTGTGVITVTVASSGAVPMINAAVGGIAGLVLLLGSGLYGVRRRRMLPTY